MRRALLGFAVLGVLGGADAGAQSFICRDSTPATLVFPTITAAAIDSGAVRAATPIAYLDSITSNTGTTANRTATIQLAGASAVISNGTSTKPIGSLEYRRADLADVPGNWIPLTTTLTTVETRTMSRSPVAPAVRFFTNRVFLRLRLTWTDAPGAAPYSVNVNLRCNLT